jgi:hypothetical protein
MAPAALPAAQEEQGTRPSAQEDSSAKPQQWQTGWLAAAGIAALATVVILWAVFRPENTEVVKAEQMPAVEATIPAAKAPEPVATPPRPTPPTVAAAKPAARLPEPVAGEPGTMQVELEATSPSWVSMTDGTGKTVLAQLIVPGSTRTVTVRSGTILRAGNAGGLLVRLDGQPIGPIGPSGGVRDVEFKDGTFTLK